MAKNFSFEQARTLMDDISTMRTNLEWAAGLSEKYRKIVELAAVSLLKRDAMKLLDEIPVEEVNRSKLGFRTKTLRDSGFHTMGDLMRATVPELERIRGISEDGARMMKVIAIEMRDNAIEGAKLRLSLDDRSEETANLLVAVSKYKNSSTWVTNCANLRNQLDEEAIDEAMADLQSGTGAFRWMFAGSAKKDRAVRAYRLLEKYHKDCFQKSNEAVNILRQAAEVSEEAAREEFRQEPMKFVGTLEYLLPEFMGDENSVYGLPEELAEEIRKEDLPLNGMNCVLRKYQEWGVKYILHQKRVLLGDEMGLGKTIQAIAAMVALRNAGNSYFMVVCPASVLSNWCREIAKMSDLEAIKIHGADRNRMLKHWLENGGVAVTTYETTGLISLPENMDISLLVVDEAHYVKNPEAKRSIRVEELCFLADNVLLMTGTALENRVDEMINLIRMLQPDVSAGIRGMEALSTAPEFRKRVAQVYYRRRREDVLTELPELIESAEWCTMTKVEEARYELSVLQHAYNDARRVSWNVKDISKSSKARRLMELVEEASADGRKILVFSFFLDTLDRVTQLLGPRCMGPITGSVPPERRQAIIDEFNEAPAGTVLAAQIQSGGTGLNIQSASVVILCEPQLKPSTENQAISRAYRMGQTRNVLVYRLLCDDSIDESIMDLLSTKQNIFDAFADESEAAKQEIEVDETGLQNILRSETERIAEKQGTELKNAEDPEERERLSENVRKILEQLEKDKSSVLDINDYL